MSFVIYGILIYLALVFIFRVVIPVYLASRKFKQGFKQMKERMEEQMAQQQGYQTQTTDSSKTKQSPPKSDYIEFEEIK